MNQGTVYSADLRQVFARICHYPPKNRQKTSLISYNFVDLAFNVVTRD